MTTEEPTGEKYLRPDQSSLVLEAERVHLGKTEQEDLCGLAISGGGIRSASFGLGVMQALRWEAVLEKMDYLSTVSGGGYIGSSLTWWLNHEGYSVSDDGEFPFGAKDKGARVVRKDPDKKPDKKPNQILDFIRQHGNYLSPGNGVNVVSMGAITFRAMFVSLLIHFLWLTVAMLALMVLIETLFGGLLSGLIERGSLFTAIVSDIKTPVHRHFALVFLGLLIALAIGFVGSSLFYSMVTMLGSVVSDNFSYEHRTGVQKVLGRGFVLAVLFAVVGSLPFIYGWVHDWKFGATASLPTLSGVVIGYLRHRKQRDGMQPDKARSSVVPAIGAALVLWGLLFGAFGMATLLVTAWIWWALVIVFAAVVLGVVVNINHLGIHRTYRDRLMETFLPDITSVETNTWGRATGSNTALIEDMCQHPNQRPYHLINTNIVLVDSPTTTFRGRGGDSFVISPLYCGSNATGWRGSDRFMKYTFRKRKRKKSKRKKGMTLPTAMAISGAAANPNTAVAGRGVTRNRMVSTLMSLLNVRLGYWVPHPNPEVITPRLKPNFLYPGLRGGVLPGGLRENRKYLELTDGGHFENLAIYELIRRKLKLIIVCDGGADPRFEFGDLANAVERAKVDFGTKIRFEDTQFGLRGLLPGSAGDKLLRKKYGLAARGFAIGSIEYPDDDKPGVLIYLKTTLTADLPPDVYGYKSANPSFPDQSTADQFFDEAQFEAYRELGYYLGKQMLSSNRQYEWI